MLPVWKITAQRSRATAIACSDPCLTPMTRCRKPCCGHGKPGASSMAALRSGTWLYRIATNVCLDELKDRGRRAIPVEEGAPGATSIENLAQQPNSFWIEPMLDEGMTPAGADPAEQLMLRQSIRLAFMAALQHLAPKQRAALLLTEVLGFSAGEAASTLD